MWMCDVNVEDKCNTVDFSRKEQARMTLRQQMEAQGVTLFRWRSFMPLMILPVVVLAGLNSQGFADGHAGFDGRLYDLGCILLSFSGLAMRSLTVASAAPRTSGRNTREQRADSLNTTGAYSIVRNPLYVANFFVFLGMLLFLKVWWVVVIATLSYVMYYERIVMAEEDFLLAKFGTVYAQWSDRTPAMVPNLRLWQKPERQISWRKILRGEYNGFYLIVVCFYLLEWCDRLLFARGQPGPVTLEQAPGLYWTSFLAVGTFTFMILRTLKKHTDILNEPPADGN